MTQFPVFGELVLGSETRQVCAHALDASDELMDVFHVLLAVCGLGQHGAVEGDVRRQRERPARPLADPCVRVWRRGLAFVQLSGSERHGVG
jgi:hypothetical protein